MVNGPGRMVASERLVRTTFFSFPSLSNPSPLGAPLDIPMKIGPKFEDYIAEQEKLQEEAAQEDAAAALRRRKLMERFTVGHSLSSLPALSSSPLSSPSVDGRL